MISDATLRRVLPAQTVALTGDLVRALSWGAVVLIWLTYLQIYARLWRLTFTEGKSDFAIFYYTARLVADGLPMYGSDPARYGINWGANHLGNLNPPHFQLLLQPLAALTYSHAFAVWSLLSLAALVASVALVVRSVGIAPTWKRVALAGALTISTAAFTNVAETGELTFLLLLPFTLSFTAAREGRWRAAGAWLGVCVSFKLFFLLFAPWLIVQRRWAALVAAAGTAAAIAGAGAVAYGLDTYALWLGALRNVQWEWLHLNASWPGFVKRLLQDNGRMAPLVDAASWVRPLAAAGSIAVCAISLFLSRRLTQYTSEIDVAYLVLVMAALLASPLGWVYYLPLALGPFLAVLVAGDWRRLPLGWLTAIGVAMAGWYLPQEVTRSAQPSRVSTLLLASAYFWGTAAVWAGSVALARRAR